MVANPTLQPRSRRQFLGVLGAVALGGLAACSKSGSAGRSRVQSSVSDEVIPTARPQVSMRPPTSVRDVTSFGAVGDGSTDDTAAIQRAIDSMDAGSAVRFPAGMTFCHDDVLVVRTAGTQLLGPGTLRATREHRSALQIRAADVTVDGLVLSIEKTSQRWSTPAQHKLMLAAYDGIVVKNVRVEGSAAAGVFCLGTSNFVLQGLQVSDTRADGIHMTDGCHDGLVEAPVVTRSGDDAVAVVSYLDDAKRCEKITILSPRVRTTTGGRGLSVVGGHNVIYRDIDVADSFAAAVYVACEGGPSVTYPSEGVRVIGGTITGANTDSAIDHGAVLVYSGRSGGAVRDVIVSGLTISDTRATASRQVGAVADNHDALSEITFEQLRLDRHPQAYQGNAPLSALSVIGVVAGGDPVQAPR